MKASQELEAQNPILLTTEVKQSGEGTGEVGIQKFLYTNGETEGVVEGTSRKLNLITLRRHFRSKDSKGKPEGVYRSSVTRKIPAQVKVRAQ